MYNIPFVLQVINEYIKFKKGINYNFNITLDTKNEKEMELFLKASNIALYWYENYRNNGRYH